VCVQTLSLAYIGISASDIDRACLGSLVGPTKEGETTALSRAYLPTKLC
jgi:hypothetical protein